MSAGQQHQTVLWLADGVTKEYPLMVSTCSEGSSGLKIVKTRMAALTGLIAPFRFLPWVTLAKAIAERGDRQALPLSHRL
jgi:hypothetical protein